jgi:predicted ATP-binding protein involved in virulence
VADRAHITDTVQFVNRSNMRIDTLRVQNFRGFAEREFGLHPQFNILIGDNATGKTAALEALAVAMSTWFQGIEGAAPRGVREEDVRLVGRGFDGDYTFEQQYPVVIEADGQVSGEWVSWRSIRSGKRASGSGDAAVLEHLAKRADQAVRDGEPVTLPLIAYYGTGRLSKPVRNPRTRSPSERALQALRQVEGVFTPEERDALQKALRRNAEKVDSPRAELSRFAGYHDSMDPRIIQRDLTRWMERQAWTSFEEAHESTVYTLVRSVLAGMIEGAETVGYTPKRREVVVRFRDGSVQPLGNLSDGQRNVLALVGDIAIRMVRLNPHLGEGALAATPGVVLIDELDMHLHPTWQRRITDDLRTTFPRIQFVATTHSPLIIGGLQPEEVLRLDDPSIHVPNPPQAFGLDPDSILRQVMLTEETRPPRALALISEADEALERGELQRARSALDEMRIAFHGDTIDTVGIEATINNLTALADADDHEG